MTYRLNVSIAFSLVQQHAFAFYGRGLIPGRDIWIPFTVISAMTSQVSLINAGQTERTKLQTNYQISEQITEFDWHIR
jgi:hypothetical protein